MLVQISIHNFALIQHLVMEFGRGLNVLTGATGAGKSILIDALRMCLGERMDTAKIRDPRQICRVEAIFEISDTRLKNHPVLSGFIQDDDEYIILKREYTPDAKTRARVNQSIVNISTLKEIGRLLVDLHGQYDHQLLFDTKTHQYILDKTADIQSQRQKYKTVFEEYRALTDKMEQLNNLAGEDKDREIDLLEYQINEITQADIKQDEEETLHEEYKRLNNAERLCELVNQVLSLCDEAEGSLSENIQQCFAPLTELAGIDSSMSPLVEKLQRMQDECQDITVELQSYRDGFSFEADRLSQILERIELIDNIKKKYGQSPDEINQFLENAQKKYDDLINAENIKSRLHKQIKQLLPKLQSLADELTQKRKNAAGTLTKVIQKELEELGMPNTKFQVRFIKCDFHSKGQENIEFFISPNLGEELKPLAKIVSGGEAARLMLALKKALVGIDPIPTLIFDEIDSNIGGRLGSVVGEKLKEVSQSHQVLLITHLPQIAAFADIHFKILKAIQDNRAITKTCVLENEDRITELAKMMSGEKETELSREHAQQMLMQALNDGRWTKDEGRNK